MYPFWIRLLVLGVALLPAVLVVRRERTRLFGQCWWCDGPIRFLPADDEFFCSDWCFDQCAALCPPVGLDA